MSPLPRQGWLFLIEFLKWYFSKYWQVRTRPVFAQTVTYYVSTIPHPGDVREEVGNWIMQTQMHHLLGMPVSQIPTFFPPKRWRFTDLRGDLLVNVHTSVYAYGKRSNSPRIGQVLVSNFPLFSLHSPAGRVLYCWVLYIDQCIAITQWHT